MSLADLKVGESAFVCHISDENSLKRRLYDLGFLPGSFIECVLVSPFSSPVLYKVNGAFIALRISDAKGVDVSYEK